MPTGQNMSGRPKRLPGFPYVGLYRYFLTLCTFQRHQVFTDAAIVAEAIARIRKTAESSGFSVVAYCFMPDHLHLLVAATADSSNLVAFVHAIKQQTAYYYSQKHHGVLWQQGYYEHIVRDDEASWSIARYIFENPVRAGLVVEPRDYQFSGSFEWTRAQMDELWLER